MKATAINELVLSIKQIVSEKKLSQKQLQKLVWEKTGAFISDSTIYRVLKDGSEDGGFNYTKSLEPICRALMSGMSTSDEVSADEMQKLYEAALLYKEAEIEELNASIEQIKAEYEKRCREYEDRLTLWLDQIQKKDEQIQKKDQRMDRKDHMLDQRDEEIRKLREKIELLEKK